MMRTTTARLISSLTRLDGPLQDHLTTAHLRGLSTPTDQIAWVSGSMGTFLRTINQGKNWEVAQIVGAEALEFRDIKAFDEHTAYIMSAGHGEASRIYKTKDGGQSWELQIQSHNPAEFFNCMAFWNQDRGMVLSDPVNGKFKLYSTENSGCTWSSMSESGMPPALHGEGAFAASGSCMTVKGEFDAWFGTGVNTARVFHTNNAGKNWEVVTTPIMQDSQTSGIFSIAFYDLKNGVIAGGDYKLPEKGGANLAITSDGGLSWELASILPQYYWSAASFTPHRGILLAGSKHIGLTQSILPKTWEKSWNSNDLNALSFWSNDKALSVGQNGIIMELEIPKLKC